MIVESSGSSIVHTNSVGAATMIVSTTGTAYVKKGKIKSVMRFFRKMVAPIKTSVKKMYVAIVTFRLNTKTGKPTSIDPPLENNSN